MPAEEQSAELASGECPFGVMICWKHDEHCLGMRQNRAPNKIRCPFSLSKYPKRVYTQPVRSSLSALGACHGQLESLSGATLPGGDLPTGGPGFGFRVSGFGLRVAGFELRVAGCGFRVGKMGAVGSRGPRV